MSPQTPFYSPNGPLRTPAVVSVTFQSKEGGGRVQKLSQTNLAYNLGTPTKVKKRAKNSQKGIQQRPEQKEHEKQQNSSNAWLEKPLVNPDRLLQDHFKPVLQTDIVDIRLGQHHRMFSGRAQRGSLKSNMQSSDQNSASPIKEMQASNPSLVTKKDGEIDLNSTVSLADKKTR